MTTSSILLVFLGSFALYNTSKQAVLRKNMFIKKWLQAHTAFLKVVGLALLIKALLLFTYIFGYTGGFLLWLFSTIATLSLIVLLCPLKRIRHKHILIIFILFLISELIA